MPPENWHRSRWRQSAARSTISTEESQKVVNFIKNNNEAYYDENATAFINNARGGGSGGDAFGGGLDLGHRLHDGFYKIQIGEVDDGHHRHTHQGGQGDDEHQLLVHLPQRGDKAHHAHHRAVVGDGG